MKLRLHTRDIVFTVMSSIMLLLVLFGLGVFPSGASRVLHADSLLTSTIITNTSNAIVRENALQGTTDWQIPDGHVASTQIQAYASSTSVLPENMLTFYVSTQKENTSYSIGIYRLGWYNGLGGRLERFEEHLSGHAQGYFDNAQHKLVSCTTCRVDLHTGLVEAYWQPSYTLTIPASWTTGVYLAKFVDMDGMQTYTPFDVQGNTSSTYVAVTPDTTYEAYNRWGGSSLYATYEPNGTDVGNLGRGVKVSFNRPYVPGNGSAQVLSGEADALHWLERQGYDISYISDIDLQENPTQLLHHRAYLSLGHDEYWTKEMRDGVEHARDSGVSLAFLGANDAYWQMRFEPDSAGGVDRTIVCYKVQTQQNNLNMDPFYQTDRTRITAQWRDPVLARPENALIGIMSSSLNQQQSFSWQVSTRALSPLLNGTTLQPGKAYGCDIVGNEWDRVFNNGATPSNLQVLSESPTVDYRNIADVSNTTYYVAPSGAMVFDAGSIYWTIALDNYRFDVDKTCASQNLAVPEIQNLMAHVMNALIVKHS